MENLGTMKIEKSAFELLVKSVGKGADGPATLQGIFIDATPATLHLVATDTFRLTAVRDLDYMPAPGTFTKEKNTLDGCSCIITVAALKARIVVKPTKKNGNNYAINLDDITPRECVEGRFPQWKNIIPKESNHTLINFGGEVSSVFFGIGACFGVRYIADIAAYAESNGGVTMYGAPTTIVKTEYSGFGRSYDVSQGAAYFGAMSQKIFHILSPVSLSPAVQEYLYGIIGKDK